MSTGLIYTITGNDERGQVTGYHHKPAPLFLNKTKYRSDVAGLKPATIREALRVNGEVIESRFTVGFEVEKNQLHRGAVREYELFCGFERDGSCGYEAVTHILPLLPSGLWRTKVYDMMYKAERIIDDRYSPSNKQCGGHITLACDGLSGNELRSAVRKNAGIVLALFRKRLSNSYCNHNLTMLGSENAHIHANGYHGKYQLALVKGECLEFRVPSRFESVKQMMRRYELFYELVNYSVNKPNGTFKAFLKHITPLIVSMYNGDAGKAGKVIELAERFQKFINTGEWTDEVRAYVSGNTSGLL
jgi:hypothetical protein